jgi:DNA replication regulator SLD2
LLILSLAASYKEYNKLRKKSAPAQQPRIDTTRKDECKVLKERPLSVASATPKKSNKTVNKLSPLQEGTPAHVRTALGPTPHKDGRVLSIFDMVPNGTPSRSEHTSTAQLDDVISVTPSKATTSAYSKELFSRTPQSSGKRYYLESFAGTPLKRKREGELDTPMTVKRQYMTPMFLRRSTSLATVQEDSQASGVSRQPLKKKGLARNLSTIIQRLRNLQEDQMDDEWDILNEVEGGESEHGVPKILVEDSQAAAMPLGPDHIIESAEDEVPTDPGALDAEGKPRKVWKKKGLKRQTRRVIMRPVMHKPQKAVGVEEADSGEDENDVAGETQLDEQDEAEDVGDGDYEERHDSQQSQHEPQRKGSKKKQSNPAKEDGKGKKVAADAHANFRKLKIKNKNSKASGRGKKFGRR